MYDDHLRQCSQLPGLSGGLQDCDTPQLPVTAAEAAEENAKVGQFFTSSKAGRRNSVSAQPVSLQRVHEWQAPYYEKSPEHVFSIKDAVLRNDKLQVLFGHLSADAINRVVGAFFYKQVEEGEIVIQQGADGDFFYIVYSGFYDIFVQRQADLEADWVMRAEPGTVFGELALMYNVPRAATVRSATQGGLWCLDRESFQMMLVTSENSKSREYVGFLANVALLSGLTAYELSTVSDLLDSEPFGYGETIVLQGDLGDTLFFLYEGSCKAFMTGQHGEVEVKDYSVPGEYFGEVALITNEARRATVRASGPEGCVVLKLKREDVDLSIGSLHHRLMTNVSAYPGYEAFLYSLPQPA